MYDTMKNFIQKLKSDKQKRKRLGVILGVLSLIVASGVTWQLRITGITMSDVPCCSMEEHIHSQECMEQRLICGLTEETAGTVETLPPPEPELICEAAEHTHGEGCYHVSQELTCEAAEHTHDDNCYEITWELDCAEEHEHDENCPQKEIKNLICTEGEHTHGDECYLVTEELACELPEHTHGGGCYTVPETQETQPLPEIHVHTEACWESVYICDYNEEHVHTLDCYSNPDADLETPDQWESTLPALTGDRAADLAAVARSQVSYRESDDNFIVAEDGTTRMGITRYGQWYGNPYGEWDAMFATFCLRYAGISESVIPGNSGCYAWTAELGQRGMLLYPADYYPLPGDLAFFDRDEDGTPDHVGIVIRADGPFFSTVEGGRDDCVEIYAYNRDDACVFGFVNLQEPEEVSEETTEETTDETVDETTDETTEETVEETTEETVPEELLPLVLDVLVYEDSSLSQPVEGAIPMTITGLMPEGLTAKAYPVDPVLEGLEIQWAFYVGLYREDGELWKSPEEPLIITMTVPQFLEAEALTLEETAPETETDPEAETQPETETQPEAEEELPQPVIYHIIPEGEPEAVSVESAGELLAFEAASGEAYAAALPVEEPVQEPEPTTLTVEFFEDETYAQPIEGAPEVTVTGFLPENASARAYLTEVNLPEVELLWAFHMAVFTETGEVWEPEEDQEPLNVNVQLPQLFAQQDEDAAISMYQVPEEGTEELLPTRLEEGNLSFKAAKPAIYAAALVNISDEEALRNAAQVGGQVELSGNLSITGADPIVVSGDLTIDLKGSTITATQLTTLFQVDSTGSLTIMDSLQAGAAVSGGNTVSASQAGQLADYTDGTLTYYVTDSQITDSAIGATLETRNAYTVSLPGRIEGGIQVNGGSFTLQSGAIIGSVSGADDALTNDHLTPVSSAVSVTGGGTVNLEGGYICGSENGVHAEGSTVHLTGTVLAGNSAGAVELYNGSHMTMIGGIISGNSAKLRQPSLAEGAGGEKQYECGAGVYCSGSTFTMRSGYITNNRIDSEISNNNPYCGGSGVYVAHTAENSSHFTLSGGYITGNYGPSGGGIHTVNVFGMSTRTYVTMTGGFVSGNYASRGEGGGMTLRSMTIAKITAGHITNNETATTVDWGGGGIFCSQNAELAVQNTLITENQSGGFGGGLTGCSTGVIRIGGEDSVAIYDNWADGWNLTAGSNKDDDHLAFADSVFRDKYGYKDYYCEQASTVSGIMLGGGNSMWYGSAKDEASDSYPVTPDNFKDAPLSSDDRMGLTAAPSQEDIGKAQAVATVFITGNRSYTHGGGILVNGITTFGSSFHVEKGVDQEILGSVKSLVDGEGNPLLDAEGNPLAMEAERFTFLVTQADEDGNDTETVVSTGKNNAQGQIVFDNPLSCPGEGTYIFYIHEQSSEDLAIIDDTTLYQIKLVLGANETTTEGEVTIVQWRVTDFTINKVLPDGTLELVYHSPENTWNPINVTFDSMKFKNTSVDKLSIEVHKVWKDGDGNVTDNHPDSVTVYLTRNGMHHRSEEEADKSPVTLSADNGWSYTWPELPGKDEKGDPIRWGIEEDAVNGWTPHISYSSSIGGTDPGEPDPPSGPEVVYDPVPGVEYYIGTADGQRVISFTGSGGEWDTQLKYEPMDTIVNNAKFVIKQSGDKFTIYNAEPKYSTVSFLVRDSQWNDVDLKVKPSPISHFRVENGYLVVDVLNENNEAVAYSRYLTYKQFGTDWKTGVSESLDPANTFRLYTIPGSSGGGDTGGGGTTSDSVVTITNTAPKREVLCGFNLEKVDSENTAKLLPGAVFKLERGNKLLLFTYNETDGCYVYQSEVDKPAEGEPMPDGSLLTTGENGTLSVRVLPEGTYVLTEIEPPPGYTMGTDSPLEFGLPIEGNPIPNFQVKNNPIYYSLPKTGGMGTIGFTLLGVLLMAASLGWWIYLQKRNREEGRAL